MKNNKCAAIQCFTYKEAFTLRRALIDFGEKNSLVLNLKEWKERWDRFKDKTIYYLDEKNRLIATSHKDCVRLFSAYQYYTLKDYVKNIYK